MTGTNRTKGRSAEDLDLWRSLLSGVKKLKGKKRVPEIEMAAPRPPKAGAASKGVAIKEAAPGGRKKWVALAASSSADPKSVASKPAAAHIKKHGLAEADRKSRKALAKGRRAIDATLDLHGLRQHEAQARLARFILRAHADGQRALLVITGKGKREGEGVLRANLRRWIEADAELAARVLSVSQSAPPHGGDGAFYILLRRK